MKLAFGLKYRNKKPCILSVPYMELVNEVNITEPLCLGVSIIDNDFVCAAYNSRSGCSRTLVL